MVVSGNSLLPFSFLFLLLCSIFPSSDSQGRGGNTHPVLQSGEFASIGSFESSSGPSASTERPVPFLEEIPIESNPVKGPEDTQQSSSSSESSNRGEFFRPKRTTHVTKAHQSTKPDLVNAVSNLKNQLMEAQAAQVHTRSIINVLQEKLEAQENDLSKMKNEISILRREQLTQRQLMTSLTSKASDALWAIANVKRSQDQTSSDVRVIKRLQERHNETLLVMDKVMANSAVKIHNQDQRSSSIQQELIQLKVQVAKDRGKMDKLNRVVDQLQTARETESENENRIDEIDATITNHLSVVHNPQPSVPRIAPPHGKKPSTATGPATDRGAGTLPPSILTKLGEHDIALELTKGILGNLSDHVASVETQLSVMSQRQQLDAQLLQFQQSFINFTSQIYQLQQWRKTQTERGRNTEEHVSQHENDMASVIFHLESQTERLHLLEELVTEYRTKDRPSLHSLIQAFSELNHSVSIILLEKDQSKSREEEKTTEARLKTTEEGFQGIDGRLKEVEITILNISLSQCKAANEQLIDDVRGGNYVRQMAEVQMRISEQTTSLARLDRGLAGIFQELDKNTGTSSSLAEQLNELKKLTPEVATIQRELINFVLQLPTDCRDVPASTGNAHLHEGVYLIRPETSRQSARTFCLVEDGAVWTVIQRRTDGRESFARSWDDYRAGFGDAGSEFWLGNENIHRLTDVAHIYRLRIDLWDVLGRYWLADYGSFRVHPEDALYRLELGEFRGNATDALRYSNLMPFSALDRDNDVSTTHCAQYYQSGWWYKHCHYSNLNGRYTAGIVWFHKDLDEWIQLKQTTMRISMATGSDDVTKRPSG